MPVNYLSHLEGTIRHSNSITRPAPEKRYANGTKIVRRNAGDEWSDQLARQRKSERAGLRPCGIVAANWPIFHMRCCNRPRCWAAIASDLGLTSREAQR